MHGIRRRYERKLSRDIENLKSKINVEFAKNPFRSLVQRFIIAASPRTGSTLLSESLLNYDVVVAESLLHVHVVKACHKQGGMVLGAYCERYLRRNARNGIFGTKGWPPLLAPLTLSGEFPAYLEEWKFVHLTRVDVLKQAISRVIASETLTWKSRKVASKIVTDEDFDADKISKMVEETVLENQRWSEFFELFSIEPLRITYEELAADPTGVVASVADYLGLSAPSREKKLIAEPLKVQSTSLNASWEERFLRLGLMPRVESPSDLNSRKFVQK